MKQGVPTGTVIASPRARARRAAKMRRQEASWRAKSGPVTVKPLLARDGGRCYWCPEWINTGDPIALYVESSTSKWWGHAACVAAARDAEGRPM